MLSQITCVISFVSQDKTLPEGLKYATVNSAASECFLYPFLYLNSSMF